MHCARTLLEASGQRYLLMRADAQSREIWIGVYRNVCYRVGIQSHSARYAFADERIQAYPDEGFGEHEARAATSLDLDHGDGRGRHVASVRAASENVCFRHESVGHF